MQRTIQPELQRIHSVLLNQRELDALAALESQERITSWPYYSKTLLRLTETHAGTGSLYTLIPQEVRAFGYAQRDSRVPGGWTVNDGVATPCDTNIQQRGQTISGQNVYIFGVSAQVLPAVGVVESAGGAVITRSVDRSAIAAIVESVSWRFALNGEENAYNLGPLTIVPGAGGIYGSAEDIVGARSLAGSPKEIGFPSNGNPQRDNYFQLPEGLIWQRTGKVDGDVQIIGRVERQATIQSGGSPENATANTVADNAPATASTGLALYDFPATALYVCILWQLHGEVIADRTKAA